MAADNRGPQVAAVAIGFLTISWVFVSLRCYVRIFMTKAFGVDDWLAVASQVLFSIYCAFVLKGVQYGTGQHLSALPEENIPIALKWWYLCEIFYVSGGAVFKASICLFIARICVKRTHLYIIYGALSTVVVFSIAYIFIIIFQCSPASYFWTQYTGGEGFCLDERVITYSSYAHSAISAVVDWTMGVLPIFLVRDLAMNTRTKVVVSMILALGAVGSTATIVRIPYLKQLALSDFLYSTTDVAIWSTVEPGIGITAAAMACLRPLFRTFLSRSRLFGSSSAKKSSNDVFPSGGRGNYGGYIRSGVRKESRIGVEELGLRDDVGKGNGITTTIKGKNTSPSDSGSEELVTQKRTRPGETVKGALNWDNLLKDDSEEEILSVEKSNTSTIWGVRKTTTVEVHQGKLKGPGQGRGQDSYLRVG